MLTYLLVLVVGLFAGTVSGIVGTGASIMLLPVLVFAFGPKQAIPIMAVAAVLANIAKVAVWRKEIDWRASLAYSATGIPAAALGARTLLVLPSGYVDFSVGIFFLVLIPFRRWMHVRNFHLTLVHLAIIGAGIGFLTGIVVSTGALSVAAFAAYGLIKGPFIATEAATSLVVFATKVATFQALGALPTDIAIKGLITGSSLMVGAFVSKRIVLKLTPEFYRLLLDGLLLFSGVTMLWIAIAGH